MKRFHLHDLPMVVKIGFAPAFAVLMLALVAGGALWSQHEQSRVLERVVNTDMPMSARLLQASQRITSAHAALYQLLTRQAAGGSGDASQKSLTALTAQVDAIKADLATIQRELPADQQTAFKSVLKDIGDYRGGIDVVGSMLGIDFKSAAAFVEPFQAQYDRMTQGLAAASHTVEAGSSARSQQSVRQSVLNGEVLAGVVLLTLGAVAAVAVTAVLGVRRAVTGISEATERLAAGDGQVDLERLHRRDELGAIVRSLSVFRDNQQRIVVMRREQEALAASEAQARAAQERERAQTQAEQHRVVEDLAGALERLAGGDLEGRLERAFPEAYEKLRTDYNAAVGELASAMAAILATSDGIRGGAGEISGASEDLSRRTEQQAASLEQTAAALDEITATVTRTSEGATHARQVVAEATEDAERSSAVVSRAVAAMSGIDESSRQISQIIGVIDEIAFQTNLLALNAGVEAARAGDAGRGFAVVASEVRALAQRSAGAAKEIKTLISASGQQVKAGVELVGETGTALGRIIAKVTDINEVVAGIATSAKEQASGLKEVNIAINQMDQFTQQNAAMVEETTAASQSLARETETLAQLVGRFAGARGPQTAAPQPSKPAPPPRRAEPSRPAARAALKTTTSAVRKVEPEASTDDWTEF